MLTALERPAFPGDAIARGIPMHRDRTQARSRAIVASALALILIAAAWLRLTNLSQVGIRFEDEAAYFADARLWHRCAKVLFSAETAAAIASDDKAPMKAKMAEVGIDFGARYHKPCQGYTALGSAMMFLVGDRDVALLAVSAVAGTVSVFFVWLLGNLLFGQAVALCAAALLAVSPFHLLYCRSAYPDATMIAFSLAAVTAWVATRQGYLRPHRTYLVVGCLFGVAATCHYRCGGILLALLCVDYLVPTTDPRSHVPGENVPAPMRRWGLMLLGFAVPVAAIEGTMRMVQLGARLTNSWFPVESFLEAAWALAKQEHMVGASAGGGSFWSLNADALTAYPRYLVHSQGLLTCVLLLVGLLHLCRHGRRRSLASLPLTVIVVTGTLLILQPYVVARGMSVTLPFIQLCVAVGIARSLPDVLRRCKPTRKEIDSRLGGGTVVESGTGRVTGPRWSAWIRWLENHATRGRFAFVILTVVLCSEFRPLQETLRRRSDLAAACALLSSLGPGTAVIAEDPRKYEVYLEGSNVELVRGQRFRAKGEPQEMLAAMREAGLRWVIADPQRWHYRDLLCPARDDVSRWWQDLERLLERSAEPIAEFPHVQNARWEFLAEGPGLNYLEEMTLRGDGPIRIYDITVPQKSRSASSDRPRDNESPAPLLPITR